MELSEKEKEFMVGLGKLTRKTGIKIFGCGCCESPSLEKAEITDEKSGYGFGYADEVSWIDPTDKYDWNKFSKSIITEE